ncbi:MAG: zinc-ribbon domain-containing protein [Candidatus Bathyarchaeota archaeon]|nr:zinc-ribbon domain-containing protein [Candidatus Bathyarchaeota archaeon]
MVFCSNCGSKIDDEAYFCPHCGTRTPKGREAKVSYPADELYNAFTRLGDELENAFTMAAHEVRAAINRAQDKPTPNSQTAQAQNIILCPKCGTKNPAGSIFCNNCGTRLTPVEESHGGA